MEIVESTHENFFTLREHEPLIGIAFENVKCQTAISLLYVSMIRNGDLNYGILFKEVKTKIDNQKATHLSLT